VIAPLVKLTRSTTADRRGMAIGGRAGIVGSRGTIGEASFDVSTHDPPALLYVA
jgi:hypothetical protein